MLRQPLDPTEFIGTLRDEMTGELAALDDELPSLDWVEIGDRGRQGAIKLTPIPAVREPVNLRSLKTELQRRWGPHTVDRYATAATARVRVFNSLLPEAGSAGAAALAQEWMGENNYVFPPPAELPRIAQLLHERPAIAATVVVPHWPAQAWFQQLTELAEHVETWPLAAAARPADWLPTSALTALSGAMLTFVRVAGRRGGRTGGA